MQKKVYTKDIDLGEIVRRLKSGQRLYNDGNSNYIAMNYENIIEYDSYGHPKYFNYSFSINSGYFYFLDEVEEPEADKSCIGKLCKFWNEEDDEKEIGFLGEIDKEHNFPFAMGFGYAGVGYKHCRPLTEKEALALVKE